MALRFPSMDFNMDFNSVITSSELESSYASNTEIRFIIVSTITSTIIIVAVLNCLVDSVAL